jgi:long-chain acyl-CoA synthetase
LPATNQRLPSTCPAPDLPAVPACASRWLYKWGLARKRAFLQQGRPLREASPLFDRLIFRKVQAALGGRLKFVASGSAPLSPRVEEWVRAALCCYAGQGYGLTETCAVTCVTIPDRYDMRGTVGVVQPCAGARVWW